MSLCDLLSCVFSVLNVLEHTQSPYNDVSSTRFREICLYLSLYTHPIAVTLQALSVWIICAFSIHRCKSIINLSSVLRSDNHLICKPFKSFCCGSKQFNLFNQAKQRFLKWLRKSFRITSPNQSNKETFNKERTTLKRPPLIKPSLWSARLNIILLYLFALVFLIPQLFEKRIILIEIDSKHYLFTELTEFGKSKLFRQIFHLWFYLMSVYVVPFILIFTFNFILLSAFLNSKKKCKQYLIKKQEQNEILIRETKSVSANNLDELNEIKSPLIINSNNKNNLTVSITHTNLSSISIDTKDCSSSVVISDARSPNKKSNLVELSPSIQRLKPEQPVSHRLTLLRKQNSARITNRSRSLTLLLTVVCVFGVCHLPATISKIIYAVYPMFEFQRNYLILLPDVANFLIMFNSSINFLLYIVFGPGRFRDESKFIFHSMFKKFRSCFFNE